MCNLAVWIFFRKSNKDGMHNSVRSTRKRLTGLASTLCGCTSFDRLTSFPKLLSRNYFEGICLYTTGTTNWPVDDMYTIISLIIWLVNFLLRKISGTIGNTRDQVISITKFPNFALSKFTLTCSWGKKSNMTTVSKDLHTSFSFVYACIKSSLILRHFLKFFVIFCDK